MNSQSDKVNIEKEVTVHENIHNWSKVSGVKVTTEKNTNSMKIVAIVPVTKGKDLQKVSQLGKDTVEEAKTGGTEAA